MPISEAHYAAAGFIQCDLATDGDVYCLKLLKDLFSIAAKQYLNIGLVGSESDLQGSRLRLGGSGWRFGGQHKGRGGRSRASSHYEDNDNQEYYLPY